MIHSWWLLERQKRLRFFSILSWLESVDKRSPFTSVGSIFLGIRSSSIVIELTRVQWTLQDTTIFFRDSDGRWLKRDMQRIETCDTLQAEIWGMYTNDKKIKIYASHIIVEKWLKFLVNMITWSCKA